MSDEKIEKLSETESFGSMPELSEIVFSQDGERSQEMTASKIDSQLCLSAGTEALSTTLEGAIASSLMSGPHQDQDELSQETTASKIDFKQQREINIIQYSCEQKIKLIDMAKNSKYLFIQDLPLLTELKIIYSEISVLCAEKPLQNAKEKYKELKLLLETAKQTIRRQKNASSSDEVSLNILQVEAISFLQSRELFLDDSPCEELNEKLSAKIKKISLKIIKELKDECTNYQLHLQSFIQRSCPSLISTPTNIKQKLIAELLEILEKQDTSPEKKIFEFNAQLEKTQDLLKESRSILSSLQGSIFFPTQTEGEKLCNNILQIQSSNVGFICMLEKVFYADVHLERQDAQACYQ